MPDDLAAEEAAERAEIAALKATIAASNARSARFVKITVAAAALLVAGVIGAFIGRATAPAESAPRDQAAAGAAQHTWESGTWTQDACGFVAQVGATAVTITVSNQSPRADSMFVNLPDAQQGTQIQTVKNFRQNGYATYSWLQPGETEQFYVVSPAISDCAQLPTLKVG